MLYPSTARLGAGLLVGLTLALLLAACRQNVPTLVSSVSASVASNSEFLGNAACAECHEDEVRAHKGSRHDITLRAVTRESLSDVTPPTGTIPLAGYALEEQNGKFLITKQFPNKETLKLDLALGSGKTGMTFVALRDDGTLMETRMSYFPPWKFWEVTPGQEIKRPDDQPFGRVHDKALSKNCLRCHSVTVPPDNLALEPKYFGVGCEACHGPGRAHVAAIRAGEKVNYGMEDLGRWRSEKLNNLCGKCHRTVEELATAHMKADETQRFQVYGLVRSRCRLRNGQKLSCISCHNPHKDASTDHASYEAVCLSCHAPGVQKHVTANSNVANGKPCPVNARDDCIRCHMPPRKAFPATHIPAKMADHFISIPPRNVSAR